MNLVTGATGIVGTRLIFDLLVKGESVRALKRPSSDMDHVQKALSHYHGTDAAEMMKAVDWVDGDLLDLGSLDDALAGVSQVYHTAALVSYSARDAQQLIDVNVEGTANLVNLALEAGIQKLCHLSSVSALGQPSQGPATERTTWKRSQQRSIYGLSKYLAEQEIWRGAAEGLPAVVVNPSVIIGPGKPDQSSGMLMKLLTGGVAYYPPGGTGLVDVRDVSAACIALMDSELTQERFLLNADNVPYQSLLTWAAEVFGNRPPRFALQPWMLELAWPLAAIGSAFTAKAPKITKETARNACRELAYDASKVRTALGMEFIPIRESLAYFKPFFKG